VRLVSFRESEAMTRTVGAPWCPQVYHEGPSHAGGGLLCTGSRQMTCPGGKVSSTMTVGVQTLSSLSPERCGKGFTKEESELENLR
jgi:hypothetical protein